MISNIFFYCYLHTLFFYPARIPHTAWEKLKKIIKISSARINKRDKELDIVFIMLINTLLKLLMTITGTVV